MSESKAVSLKCTGCSLTRTYGSNEDIPDQYREGCPNCGAAVKVEYVAHGAP